MTGNVLIDLAVSIVGVAILIALSRVIFGAVGPTIDQDKAADRLAFDEPDFCPVAWLVDGETGAALARNEAGELAFIVAHGDGLVTRRFAPGTAHLSFEEGRLSIPGADLTFAAVSLAVGEDEAAVWLESLSHSATED